VADNRDYEAQEKKAKENWLKEYLPFEVKMMRYTWRSMA
jgi:hypothetical protein